MTEKKPINQLTIKGFKSIRNMDRLRLGSLNVLIGSNGSGKSNLVSFFKMPTEMVEGRLQVWVAQQGGADRILSFGIKNTNHIICKIEFGPTNYDFGIPLDNEFYFDLIVASADESLVFAKEGESFLF